MTTGASLEELYREVILDHFRDPRNKGTLPNPTGTFSGSNPVCGDEVTIDLDAAPDLPLRWGMTAVVDIES